MRNPTKIEFFVTQNPSGYFELHDDNDEPIVETKFPSRNCAAEAAVRFAQDQNALYALYF